MSLAHYYYNQIKRTSQAKIIYQQIKDIKEEINFTQKIDYLDNSYSEPINYDEIR